MGFGKCPEKDKRKTFKISTKCNVEVFWGERTDPYYISLVAVITAACNSLKLLCLIIWEWTNVDFDFTFYYAWGNQCTTPNGYMTIFSIVFLIRPILKPYVEFLRNETHDNLKCVLITDVAQAISPIK